MPGAVSYYIPADGIDELLVVFVEDLVHGEVLVQDAIYHNGGGPHAYDVPLARPGQRRYFAVAVAFEVDGNGPSALGASSRHDDVGTFESPLVPGALEVLYERRYTALAVQGGLQPLSLALYRGADQVAPLGPRTVVVAHLVVTEEVGEHKPGVRGALPDPAVRYYVLPPAKAGLALVDPTQLVGALEGPVFPDGPRPRHVRGPGNVPAPQSALLRIVGHVQELPTVLARAPHVHQRPAGIQVLLHVLFEGPYLLVVPFWGRVVGPGER